MYYYYYHCYSEAGAFYYCVNFILKIYRRIDPTLTVGHAADVLCCSYCHRYQQQLPAVAAVFAGHQLQVY